MPTTFTTAQGIVYIKQLRRERKEMYYTRCSTTEYALVTLELSYNPEGACVQCERTLKQDNSPAWTQEAQCPPRVLCCPGGISHPVLAGRVHHPDLTRGVPCDGKPTPCLGLGYFPPWDWGNPPAWDWGTPHRKDLNQSLIRQIVTKFICLWLCPTASDTFCDLFRDFP